MRSTGFSRIVSSLCLLSVLGLDAALAGDAAGVPTNFEILSRVSTQAADEIVTAIGAVPEGDLVLLAKAKTSGSADFLLDNAFVAKMKGAGLRVAGDSKDAAAAPARYRLSYQIVRLSLSYPKISRSWLFGPRKVERLAQAEVFAQFVDTSTGDVLWVKESRKRYADRIAYGDLARVEDPQYDFTRPAHSEFKMTRLFEPIVVGGIVVGLVYLFFSNQSNK